jgi:hypothetical protein
MYESKKGISLPLVVKCNRGINTNGGECKIFRDRKLPARNEIVSRFPRKENKKTDIGMTLELEKGLKKKSDKET